jgi:protein-tyrosine phosphatase
VADAPGRPVRLLFVCLGNICRSPTAEGVMRSLVHRERLQSRIEIESAGTGAWHVGSPPDQRAGQTARGRGITLEGTARQVQPHDFHHFDLLLAMDRQNLHELQRLAPGDDERAKVRLLRQFDPASQSLAQADLDVPDPYYGGPDGFDHVFDLVSAACEGLLEQIRGGTLP